MTGQDPAAVARPLRPAPVAPDGTILAGRGYRQAGYAADAYGGQRPAYARTVGYTAAGSSGAQIGYAPVVPGQYPHSGDPVPAQAYPSQAYPSQAYPSQAYPSQAYPPPAPQAYAPDPFEAPRGRPVPMPEAREEGIGRAIDPRFQRQEVAYDGGHRPGTIVIDTPSRFLYLVQPGGRALRYGIGVGRPGFTWSGMKTVSAKREWPDWTPPAEMLRRRPDLPRHMAGGPANPLGARALYLGSSLYRIHGTNEPHTIGQSVSSGCIRMMNEDVMDLYERVPVGARVQVI
ncbi:L,D-transpeptidase [Methylobacterium currus]|uniref:L,D-transpeptidase n=2 Tax=Methylobacterium currus TaxID=2051553 RepID=A0A2R4WUB1_9HYPH|nr:L,D-transpeptidase [Methylobacterium currus]AWB25123.1 L,D-transpeptidase [Methylobacterium currus]UHC19167.1 L,D-transpeptidase [Methylobacterium currus]